MHFNIKTLFKLTELNTCLIKTVWGKEKFYFPSFILIMMRTNDKNII